MVDLFVFVQNYAHLTLDVLAILQLSVFQATYHENRCFERIALLVLDRTSLSIVNFVEFDLDFAGRTKPEKRTLHDESDIFVVLTSIVN